MFTTIDATAVTTAGYELSQETLKTESELPRVAFACSGDTHCVSLCLLPGGSARSHHRLHHSHPALFVWETGSHEVNSLTRPTGSVTP